MTLPIVKRFLISLDENKLIGFLSFALVFGIFGVIALRPPEETPEATYKAQGALALRTPPPLFTSTGSQLQELGRRINRNILLSSGVLQRATQQLGVTLRETRTIAEKLKIDFPEAGESPVITLEYRQPQPARAELVVNVFMDEMVEESRLFNTAQLRTKIEALETRLKQGQEELRAAESQLYQFITKDGSSLLAIQDGSLFGGLTSSQQQQRQIQLALEEIGGQIDSLVKQLNLTPEQAYTSAALSADPIIADLRAQILANERQIELLTQDLRPEHPQMLLLRKQQASLENLLQKRAEEVIGSGSDRRLTALTPEQIRKESNLDPARRQLANTLVALQTQQEGLEKQLAAVKQTEQELRQQYELFPEKQLEQVSLIQEVEAQRALYQTILAVLVDAKSAEVETVSSLLIAQPAFVQEVRPRFTSPTNRLVIVAAGFGVGVVAAGGVILLLAILDSRLHTVKELRAAISEQELIFLGELPIVMSLNSKGQNLPVLVDMDSPYLAFYERFRSNIRRFTGADTKVVIVTSVSHQEGKSITAYNLAIASAHAGKRTLLLEADLRSPSQASYFNLAISTENQMEPLRYFAAREQSVRLVPEIENLYIVLSPGPQRRAAALIESSELKNLLEDARGRFDFVVVDTPSLASCNDALLLEPFTDGVILVTRPNVTQSNLFNEAAEQLAEAEVEILGAVINHVDKSLSSPEASAQSLEDTLNFSESGFTESEESETTV